MKREINAFCRVNIVERREQNKQNLRPTTRKASLSLRTMCWPHIPWLNTLKTAKTAGYINKL